MWFITQLIPTNSTWKTPKRFHRLPGGPKLWQKTKRITLSATHLVDWTMIFSTLWGWKVQFWSFSLKLLGLKYRGWKNFRGWNVMQPSKGNGWGTPSRRFRTRWSIVFVASLPSGPTTFTCNIFFTRLIQKRFDITYKCSLWVFSTGQYTKNSYGDLTPFLA